MAELFKWRATVRDYEVDFENIVHHATYVCYCEQARAEYIRGLGLDIQAMHREGSDMVVAHLDIGYKFPLQAGEQFYVTANMSLKGRLKIIFDQAIYRESDDKLIARAEVMVVCRNAKTGKPCMPEQLLVRLNC